MESTQITVVERAAKALGTAEHEKALVALVRQSASIVEIKNKDGREQAHGAMMTLKNRRTAIRKVGKDARDDATKFSKAVIAEEDRLVALIEPEETRLLGLRDSWDAAREAERVARAQAEQNRVDGIRKMIDDMRAIPVDLMDASPAQLANAIEDLEAFEATEAEFAEFVDAAHIARGDALAKLRDMHASAVRRAEEAAQIARERAELERQRAEQAERERQAAAERAEQDRIAREARVVEEARLRDEREAHEKRMADHREELRRQQDEINAERKRIAAEAAAKKEAEEAAARAAAQKAADEQNEARVEAARRKHAEFLNVGPSAAEIIDAIAEEFGVHNDVALAWLKGHVWAEIEVAA